MKQGRAEDDGISLRNFPTIVLVFTVQRSVLFMCVRASVATLNLITAELVIATLNSHFLMLTSVCTAKHVSYFCKMNVK